jgi:hypothetical protein
VLMDRSVRKTIEATGACTPADADTFTTEKPEYEAKAKAICSTCPVRQECLIEYWFEAGVVVGGTTWKERQTLTRRGALPDIPQGRLVESHTRGGVRALMIQCNQDETDAIELAKRLNRRSSIGDRDLGRTSSARTARQETGVGDRGRYTSSRRAG